MKLSDPLRAVFDGVHPLWLPFLDCEEFASALAAIDVSQATPPVGLILEAFRYVPPSEVAVVILGEDPYVKEGQAQGLCFSVPAGAALPRSLVNVFGCLARGGFRREGGSGDLRPWAVDRVLLLNTALTAELDGKSGAHLAAWRPFTDRFIREFCAARAQDPVHFLLWGGPARAHAAAVRKRGHHAHEWTHPSPCADNMLSPDRKFRACPHFEDVNAALAAAGKQKIAWDTHAPVFAFSDGGCSDNGGPKARASFAAVLVGGPFAGCVVRGEVCAREYSFVDSSVPVAGIRATDKTASPSNNRGELLGLIYAFLALLRGKALGRIEVVSDSEICLKTLKEWLPSRILKGTANQLKNYDLVAIAWRLLGELRAQATEVVLTWTKGHPKGAMPAESHSRLLRSGNQKADDHCKIVLEKSGESPEIEVLGGPDAVRQLMRSAESSHSSQ
jgi:uracil-DNA glycosylase